MIIVSGLLCHPSQNTKYKLQKAIIRGREHYASIDGKYHIYYSRLSATISGWVIDTDLVDSTIAAVYLQSSRSKALPTGFFPRSWREYCHKWTTIYSGVTIAEVMSLSSCVALAKSVTCGDVVGQCSLMCLKRWEAAAHRCRSHASAFHKVSSKTAIACRMAGRAIVRGNPCNATITGIGNSGLVRGERMLV